MKVSTIAIVRWYYLIIQTLQDSIIGWFVPDIQDCISPCFPRVKINLKLICDFNIWILLFGNLPDI